MGAVEVHLLGYYTVVFVSCDSVRVDAKSTSSLETKDVFQEELFFTLENVLAMYWNTTRHHISSSFERFFLDLLV